MLSGMNSNRSRLVMAALPALVMAAFVACERAPLVAPTNSSITISAPVRILPTGGTTELTAFVIEQAGTTVQNGTTVRFVTSLGRVDPVEVQTRNGAATTTFYAGETSGVAEIRAFSGGAGSSSVGTTPTPGTDGGTAAPPTSSSGNSVQITIGSAAVRTVTLTASPSQVPSNGGSVSIVAAALDASGGRVPNVPVSFSTSAGTLSAPIATTDSNGQATVTLTTDRETTVTALAGAAPPATVNVTAIAPNSLQLTVSPTTASAGTPVTANISPTIGSGNVPPQVTINWGDGTQENLGTVNSARSVVHIYNVPGFYVVVANATSGGETFTTSVPVTIGQVSAPTITASPSSAPAPATITFTVTPPIGVPASRVVIDYGDRTSDDLGAISSATDASHTYNDPGTYTVRVTQTNINGTTSSAIIIIRIT